MKKLFVVMIALFTMVAFAGSVMAQAPAKPAEPAKAAEPAKPAPPAEKPKADKPKAAPKALKAAGTVAGYETGKMIKVKGKDKEMAFDVTGDTKVKGEVKDGAKVTVLYKKDGDKMVATSITVAAEKKPAEKKAVEKKPAEPAKPAAPAPAKPAEPAKPAAPEKK
jgi:Cu/Ag efflux protein CusF